ncbi:MAG: hypothetical protein QM607_07360 [Microbacterium sp.]
MFVIALVLFLAGIAMFPLAFAVTAFNGVIFALGIILISAAIAVPVHFTRPSK